jgi:hypothetical protein
MNTIFLIFLSAVAFVFASVSSNFIIKNIEKAEPKVEQKKTEEPKVRNLKSQKKNQLLSHNLPDLET